MPGGRTGLAALAMWTAGLLAGVGGAHAATCEVSRSDKAGEVILTFDVSDSDGAVQRVDVTWLPVRVDGEGEESDHFSRPALMLDYRMSEGKLAGPAKAMVLISRYSGPDVGSAPKLSAVRVRAKLDGRQAAMWTAGAADGEATLARAIRESEPEIVVLDIVGPGETVLAGSRFALAADALDRLAAQARAEFKGCG